MPVVHGGRLRWSVPLEEARIAEHLDVVDLAVSIEYPRGDLSEDENGERRSENHGEKLGELEEPPSDSARVRLGRHRERLGTRLSRFFNVEGRG